MSQAASVPDDASVLKMGTRDSTLAMHQTKHVRDKLQLLHPALTYSIESMKTIGDKILDVALSKIGSKSLFTKELEEALAQKCIHIVVHSLKDMPTSLPEGMVIGAVLKREDPRDAVLLHPRYHGSTDLADLPQGAVLGSSSVRRVAQLRRHFPHLQFESVRGNLNTRLNKLISSHHYAGLVLAAAGVHRMGWTDKISKYLESSDCMYAVGQGALAVECLSSDRRTLSLIQSLSDPDSLLATVAERALMAALAGGCSAPVAVWTKVDESGISLKGGVWSLDGQKQLIEELSVCFPITDSFGADNDVGYAETFGDVSSSNGIAAEALAAASNGHVSCKRGAEDEPVEGEPSAKLTKTEDSVDGSLAGNGSQSEHAADTNSGSDPWIESIANSESIESFCGVVPPHHLLEKARVAHTLGKDLAEVLIAKGADKILTEAKQANDLLPPNLRPAAKSPVVQ